MSNLKEPQRGFFHFGKNPFKISSPKTPDLCPRLLSLLNIFEFTLAKRIEELVPKDKNDILTLVWMTHALESLCRTHESIKALILDLELPVSAWDEKWIEVYLDVSVKLLDLCNAFSSELSRLNQGQLFLQFALHNLEANMPVKARSSLDSWRNHVVSKNHRIENCHAILGSLLQSLDLPKVKKSAKGKVLMQALYGVKVKTLYISSVFVAAFSGSSKDLLYLTVSDERPWAKAFYQMQNTINGEIKNRFLSDAFTVLKELDAVNTNVKKLSPVIEDGLKPVSSEPLKDSVSELSKGLDLLSKEVDCFFKIVLTGRDTLLDNLRTAATSPNKKFGKNSDEKAVARGRR